MFCNVDSYMFEKLDWYVDCYVISAVSCTSLVSWGGGAAEIRYEVQSLLRHQCDVNIAGMSV